MKGRKKKRTKSGNVGTERKTLAQLFETFPSELIIKAADHLRPIRNDMMEPARAMELIRKAQLSIKQYTMIRQAGQVFGRNIFPPWGHARAWRLQNEASLEREEEKESKKANVKTGVNSKVGNKVGPAKKQIANRKEPCVDSVYREPHITQNLNHLPPIKSDPLNSFKESVIQSVTHGEPSGSQYTIEGYNENYHIVPKMEVTEFEVN